MLTAEQATREHRFYLALLEDGPQTRVAAGFVATSNNGSPFVVVSLVLSLMKIVLVGFLRPRVLCWQANAGVRWHSLTCWDLSRALYCAAASPATRFVAGLQVLESCSHDSDMTSVAIEKLEILAIEKLEILLKQIEVRECMDRRSRFDSCLNRRALLRLRAEAVKVSTRAAFGIDELDANGIELDLSLSSPNEGEKLLHWSVMGEVSGTLPTSMQDALEAQQSQQSGIPLVLPVRAVGCNHGFSELSDKQKQQVLCFDENPVSAYIMLFKGDDLKPNNELHFEGVGDLWTIKVVGETRRVPSPSWEAHRRKGRSGYALKDVGCEIIARALKLPLENLFAVRIANNKIGDMGARALLEAFQASKRIKMVDLRGNQISDSLRFELEAQVFHNRFGYDVFQFKCTAELRELLHTSPPECIRTSKWHEGDSIGVGGCEWPCKNAVCLHCRAFVGSSVQVSKSVAIFLQRVSPVSSVCL